MLFSIQVQSENCLSSGYSTEEEATNPKQSKVPVLPDMSGFYYATHHRDGPRPRGRPPFSHKTAKSFSERRGQRSVGRASGRPSTIRNREPHEEHGYDSEEKNFSQHYRHGEMPRQGRYGSPNRLSKRTEEGEPEKVSTASRNSPLKTSVSSEEINAAAKLNKMQRRDTPREKQRLTQDLARQKRLLSEDIARAELLHREQLSNKLDKNERKEQTRDFEELNDLSREDLQFVPQIYDDTRMDKIATMYEKVYGNLSPDISDHSQFDEMLTDVPKKDTNLTYDQERKSSFGKYKVANENIQEMKNIEFVNEAKVEVRGTNCLAQENLNGVLETNGTQKLEPLKFENVTDDELIPSDNDSGEKTVNCLTFGAVNGDIMDHSNCSINDDGDLLHLLNKPQLSHNERTSSIESESVQTANNDPDLNQEANLEQIDCVNCECVNNENEKEENTCFVKNDEIGFLSQSDNNPDHSNLQAVSKLKQLLEEPDMQCEHSSKHCDESLETGTESNGQNDVNKISASSIAQVENDKDNGKLKQFTGVENSNSENATVCPVAIQEQKNCVRKEEISADGRRGEAETDQSNNEGMSDAEELSDSDVYPAPQRGKVKKRRKRKHKTSKQHTNSTVKCSSTCSTLKGKSKSGRTGGRGKKSNKKPKSIQESDSDDAFSFLASPKNREDHAVVDRDHEETAPYQGHMVKEDSSSDPPPVLFEDSAHINETFETIDNICENSKNESEKQSSVETSVVDNEEQIELLKESDKSIKTNEVPSLTKSDHNNSVGEADENSQEILSLTSAERQLFEEQERKEKVKKEKRYAARQKRRNEEQKDNERSTPPHLVSQNRFARDLPRHNWLVERLLQQKQLCEDILNDESTAAVNDGPVDCEGEDLNTNEDSKEDNDNFELSESNIGSPKPVPEKQLEAESSDDDSSSPKDEFQSELHRSFLRRRYPTKVPRGPPKLKPATPECNKNSVSGPQHLNSLKHKLLSPKENPIMEPIPKLRKISEDCDKSDSSAETIKIETQLDLDAIQPQNMEKLEEPRTKEDDYQEKDITPIEVLNSDDEKEKKNDCSESKEYNATEPSNEEGKIESNVDKTDSNENLSLPAGRESFNLSSPKKPVAQKVVNSVPPTILSTKSKDVQSSMDKLSSSMHMSPHHRAAILIPLMPMHEGGLPMTPSMGPPSPHMKGYPPRTFAPHLISHSSSTLQPPGLFQSPHSPSGRYAGNACMHHMHGGPKGGISCKRDVNCPFHGSTPRGMHSGILGIPSHRSPVPAFSQHSHISDHMPPMFSSEHREGEKHPCTHPDCKPCQADKESPSLKFREKELESSAKISPQIPKVVKPIAHVPGKRPPLMLSHLQQPLHSSRHPPSVEGYNGEKDRRPPPGLDSLLSRNQEKTSDKPVRDSIPPGFQHLSEKRSFNHPLTLSELNRRREEEAILKARIGEHGSEYLQRPGNFAVPRLSSPPRLSSKSSSIFSPRDTATLISNQSPPLKDAETLRRFGRERERAMLLPEHLKNGPPRLRSVDVPKDMSDLRLIADRQRREDVALRDNILSKERPMLLRQMRGKETTSPEVKRLAEKAKSPRLSSEQVREDSRNLEVPHSRLHPVHENNGVFSLTNAAHSFGEFHKNIEEARANIVRDEKQSFQVLRNPEIGPSHRNYVQTDKNIGINEFERRQRVELLHSKEQDKKELTDKERQNRSPSAERERQGERLSERDKSPFRLANISPPSLRKDTFNDKMIAMDPRGRSHHRFVPRGLSLQELQIHRRREELRSVEPSHRELLSRMAMSSRAAVPHLVNPFPERKEGLFEGSEHLRIPLGLHQRSPPRGISRDFPPAPSSRLAVERLAAAAAQAKPGLVLNEKNKDVPPHLREVRFLDFKPNSSFNFINDTPDVAISLCNLLTRS